MLPCLQGTKRQATRERDSLQSSFLEQRRRLDEIHELRRDLEHLRRLPQMNSPEQQQAAARMQARLAQLEAVPAGDALVTETVGPEEIAEVVSRWTGIPVTRLNQTEKERILQLTDRLKAGVVGQEGPVTAIANAILRSRAGLGNEDRPVGSFLLLGPTGDAAPYWKDLILISGFQSSTHMAGFKIRCRVFETAKSNFFLPRL